MTSGFEKEKRKFPQVQLGSSRLEYLIRTPVQGRRKIIMPNNLADSAARIFLLFTLPWIVAVGYMFLLLANLFIRIIFLLIIFIVFATIASFTLGIKIVVSIIIILAVVMMMVNQNIRDYIIYLLMIYPLPTKIRLGDIVPDNRPTSQQS